MHKSVVIDCFPESVRRYRDGWAIVVVDVIRATTTAITAVAAGRRCFTAPNAETAFAFSRTLDRALLAGESSGDLPPGFEIDNSPAQIAGRADVERPLVLMSSSGTKVIHEASANDSVYLACFRNFSALPNYLAQHHLRVAVIGAGSKGDFREEDQMCCSWIAAGLVSLGYSPENSQTSAIIDRWRNAPPKACLCSRSVEFLVRTGRFNDLDFVLTHIEDIPGVFAVTGGEVKQQGTHATYRQNIPLTGN